MLRGAREFLYDWILLRARDLPHEAGGTPAPIILRGGPGLSRIGRLLCRDGQRQAEVELG
jgi:hypothetical protein